MANKIKVNTGSLNHTKTNVSNQIKQIRNQVTALYSDIALLDSMWEGEAHNAFHANFISDVRKLENLCKSLDGIVSYEDNAVKEYNSCEKKVADLIGGIRV